MKKSKFIRDLIETRQGFQEVRPAAQLRSRGALLINATDWRVVSQATPAAVPSSRPAQMLAFSNLRNSYDSTSNGLKTIIKFDEQELGAGEFAILGFGSEKQADELINGTFDIPLSVGGYSIGMRMRMRPITAEFDPATVTWDNTVTSPVLTYGSADTHDVLSETQLQSPSAAQTRTPSMRVSVGMQLTGPLTFYGVIIDIQPFNASASFNSCTSQWTSNVANMPSDGPYLFKF